MSRILWIANAPWAPSGYGEQSAQVGRRFRELGHDVAFAANFGLQGTSFRWDGFDVYPGDNDHGNRSVGLWAELHEADLVVFLCDAWVLKPESWDDLADDVRVAAWAPVDHYPIPPAVFRALDHERVTPVAMSKFGSTEMRRVTLDHLYVPHGVDTSVFRPRPELRDAARDTLGIPREAFLVGMVAANQGSPQMPRKGYPEAFLAFAGFAKDRDDAWLYVHADAIPNGTGINLDRCATMAGVPVQRLRFANAPTLALGVGAEVVANLYAAFDVLLLSSYGEGFGIPIVEAQACGVPVIVSKHSAMPELLGAGWLVEGQPHWDALSDAWFFMPNVTSIRAGLEAAYESNGDPALAAAAVEFAQQYDASRVVLEHWVPALDVLGCPSAIPESRQVRRARERRARKAVA